MSRGSGGWTLFEIIVVLVILGVISFFVLERLFMDDATSRVSDMDLIKSHLRYAQSRSLVSNASSTSMNWGIQFNKPTRYWMFNSVDGQGKAYRLPGDESSDGVMVLKNVQVSGTPFNITFDEFGSPVGLVANKDISILNKAGSSTVGTITVTKNTGFIP
jgi:prepilin-type N-terminal cleavage/methylation domain-containing protein